MEEYFVRKGFFFGTFWANWSGGFEGPQTFFWKSIFSSRFIFISLHFHLLSSFSSSLFSLFFILSLLSSLIFSLIFSFIFHLLLPPCLVLSCLVLSCLVLSCLVLSCLVLSCLVLSCLVLSCLVLSCLVLSCLVLSCLVLSCLSLFLSSFSVFLCLSVSVSVWCCVVLCGVVGRGVCLCVCVCVCCGTLKKREKNACVDSKTPPCVHSKRLCVCRHHAHVCFNICAWCRYTRGRYERTHGDVLNGHTGSRGSSSVLLTKICPRMVITCFRGSTDKPLDATYFQSLWHSEHCTEITLSWLLSPFTRACFSPFHIQCTTWTLGYLKRVVMDINPRLFKIASLWHSEHCTDTNKSIWYVYVNVNVYVHVHVYVSLVEYVREGAHMFMTFHNGFMFLLHLLHIYI